VYPTLESQKDLVNNIFLFACEHGEQKGFDSPLVLIQEMFEIIEEGRNKNWRLLKDTLPLNTGICIAADLGIVELVELLGNHGADPGTQYDYPIRIACEKGRVEVVRLLLRSRRVNPTANNNLALQCAAENGHIEVVRLLLNHTKILFDTNSAILAVANGHAEVARLLLYHPNVDLRDINLIMKDCVIFGNADILKLLLGHPKADPSIDNNYLIVIAAKKRGPEFVRLLLEDKKVAKSISFEDLEWIEKKFVSLKDICDQIKISRMPKFDSRDAEEQPKKILKK
jgi:ankyrin repeat protein